MNCYRTNCKCDDTKKMYCIFRLTEKQQRVIARIKNRCSNCGEVLVVSKYDGQATKLCTSCGIVTKDKEVLRYCLVDSRRAS